MKSYPTQISKYRESTTSYPTHLSIFNIVWKIVSLINITNNNNCLFRRQYIIKILKITSYPIQLSIFNIIYKIVSLINVTN